MNKLNYFVALCVMLGGTVGFAQDAEKKAEGPWKAAAGLSAAINSGNSSSQTLGGNSLLGWKEDSNGVQWTNVGAYGRSKVAGVSTTNTNNFKTVLRYDRFFTPAMSAFLLGHFGYDKPAGFDAQFGTAVGFAHELALTDRQTFRYEIGPDYTYENRTDGTTANVYSGRVYLKYLNKISDTVSFSQDVETLVNMEDTEDTRINTLTALKVKMSDIIALQAGFNMRADLLPVPGKKKVDTTTTLGLIFDII